MRELDIPGAVAQKQQPETSLVDDHGNPLRLYGFYYNPPLDMLSFNISRYCKVTHLGRESAKVMMAAGYDTHLTPQSASRLEPASDDCIRKAIRVLGDAKSVLESWI